MEGPPCDASSSRRKRSNRATTNPKPISASPVRIQAKSVLSAARYKRGSFSGKSGNFTPFCQQELITGPAGMRIDDPTSLYDHFDRQNMVNYVATVSFIVFVVL